MRCGRTYRDHDFLFHATVRGRAGALLQLNVRFPPIADIRRVNRAHSIAKASPARVRPRPRRGTGL